MCALVDDAYSFVGSDQYGIKCLTCTYDTHSCIHAAFVQAKFDQYDESYPFLHDIFSDGVVSRSPSIPLCLSKQKIDFSGSTGNTLQVIQSIKSHLSADDNGIFHIMPDDDDRDNNCSSCSSLWLRDSSMVSNVKLYLFHETIVCNGEQTIVKMLLCKIVKHQEKERVGQGGRGLLLVPREGLKNEKADSNK